MLRASNSNLRLFTSIFFLTLSLTAFLLVPGAADARFSCVECAVAATTRCGSTPVGYTGCYIQNNGGELTCTEYGEPCFDFPFP